MKIALVGGSKIPNSGGIENYMLNLALQIKKKGHEPWILCRGDEFKDHSVEGVRVTQLECKESQFSILMHNINASKYIVKNAIDVDVVNYQSIYLPFFYEWIPKRKGIKVCHTQHSFAQDNPKHNMLLRFIIAIIYRISSLVFAPIITVSEHNRALIKRRLHRDAKVINCGVNLPDITNIEDKELPKGIIKNRYYLTIGRIDPVKNLDILIKAFIMHPSNNGVQLVICGNTNNAYGEKIKKIANNDSRIIFYGPVFGEEKELLFKYCLAYCLVSTSEGFPIALLEAMSHGNTCICSDIPANTETLNQECGLWCKPKDVEGLYANMKLLEEQPSIFKHYGIEARKIIEASLTWDKISDKYIDYISTIIRNT